MLNQLRRKQNWRGHEPRRSDDSDAEHALQWTLQGHGRRGRTNNTWKKRSGKRNSWFQVHVEEDEGSSRRQQLDGVKLSVAFGPLRTTRQKPSILNFDNVQSKRKCTEVIYGKTLQLGYNTSSFVWCFNPLTAKCRIYPAQQEYCVRQLPDISGDICLDYIGTWRHKYFVSGVYNF